MIKNSHWNQNQGEAYEPCDFFYEQDRYPFSKAIISSPSLYILAGPHSANTARLVNSRADVTVHCSEQSHVADQIVSSP